MIRAALLSSLAPLLVLALASAARATAIIDRATLENHGSIVELHFDVRGAGLRWRLSGHGQQLRVDLTHANLRISPRPLNGQEQPPVTLVRAENYGAGHACLIVEVSGKVDYAIARLPRELVLRIAPSGQVRDVAAPLLVAMERSRPTRRPSTSSRSTSANPPGLPSRPPPPHNATSPTSTSSDRTDAPVEDHSAPPLQTAAIVPLQPASVSPPLQSHGHPLVVIDPGHGGRDPGTEAAGTVAEKDLALQIAQRLRNSLAARGANAELTRDNDVFLSLAERTQLANHVGADLFVSIHLNSSPDANTAGIETYYLNNTTDRATIRLARIENGVAGGYGAPGEPNLNYILTDLRQNYKANESASLAQMIEAETVADIGASLGIQVNALGARKGPFYVLVGAEMPSVLVECGFLSNPAETRLLAQPHYQGALADGIAAAVMHYFNADAAVGNL